MRDNEIDGLLRTTIIIKVMVITVEDVDKLGGIAITLGESTNGVAVAPVPFSPTSREVTYLVSP